jgi:4-hydroxyphenylacetate 3-monooxygenase
MAYDETSRPDWLVQRPVPQSDAHPNLRTGAQFRESLRDTRTVIIGGRVAQDVTREPSLRRGIDTLAEIFDAQFAPATHDIATSIDPDTGQRIATGWLVPYTREDLRRHVAMIKLSTFHTFGVFGRPPDYGPVKAIAFLAYRHLIEKEEPEAIDKMRHLIRVGQRHNLISADVIIDLQVNRKLPMPEQPGRLRVLEERKDGIILYGAKAGNSVFAQGNIGTISMPPPNPTMPEECTVWSAVPAGAPGLSMICREPITTGAEESEDHPLDARGEESDSLLVFDRVFVPWEYVFSYKNKTVAQVYNVVGRFAFWKIATRLSFRAEIFAAAAQVIVNALGTEGVPAVRALVADIIAYAATLRACMTAAVETAEPTESGVMAPNHTYVQAGRLHGIVHYPKIMQALRELSGQGLISRVPRATWERQDVGAMLDEFLPGYQVSARAKNRLFNLIWDMTCSAAAMRIALFENINAATAANLREDIYRTYDRSEGINLIRRVAGIE